MPGHVRATSPRQSPCWRAGTRATATPLARAATAPRRHPTPAAPSLPRPAPAPSPAAHAPPRAASGVSNTSPPSPQPRPAPAAAQSRPPSRPAAPAQARSSGEAFIASGNTRPERAGEDLLPQGPAPVHHLIAGRTRPASAPAVGCRKRAQEPPAVLVLGQVQPGLAGHQELAPGRGLAPRRRRPAARPAPAPRRPSDRQVPRR